MALKKLIRVTMIDGQIIDTDLQDSIQKALQAHPPYLELNAPATDQFFFKMAHALAVNGYIDEDKFSATYMKIIPPSQIKMVEIIFEKPAISLTR